MWATNNYFWFSFGSYGGFVGGKVIKNLSTNVGATGDAGSIPGSRRFTGRGNGKPIQYSCMGNAMDREVWWATVHGVAKSWTGLIEHTHT